ncbi:hypothetical protein M9H77_08451 [Catharanthus roseus]|uniref:Uncharacterized protein n=1 Tax=Catharanthus roseus TaxID=4058 RepID=A0ACC0BY69_CATRO|nr:hypothetical protein M9H77_08451 [Catharanthus roseus]
MFKQPKSISQHIAKNRRQFSSLGKRVSNHLTREFRARAKNIQTYDDSLAKGMVAFIEETMKNRLNKKNEGSKDKEKPSKLLRVYTISKEYSIEQVGVREVEELKKAKGRATIKHRVWENRRGVPSPHHQMVYDNAPPYRRYDTRLKGPIHFMKVDSKEGTK